MIKENGITEMFERLEKNIKISSIEKLVFNVNIATIRSILEKEFNQNLTDFQIKSLFQGPLDEDGNGKIVIEPASNENEMLKRLLSTSTFMENMENVVFNVNVGTIRSILKKEFNRNLTDFQIEGSFQGTLDGNGKIVMSKPDFETWDKGFEMLKWLLSMSTFLFADTDGNDELSLQELSRIFIMEDERVKTMVTILFAMFDLDRDMQLSFAECQKFVHTLLKIHNEDPYTTGDAVIMFMRFFFLFADSDENEKLSLQEIPTIKDIFGEDFVEKTSLKDLTEDVMQKWKMFFFFPERFPDLFFRVLDKDSDEQLSFPELLSFYLSTFFQNDFQIWKMQMGMAVIMG